MLLNIILLVFLIIGSGFFSSSETALTAASKARMAQLANQGYKRAIVVNTLRARMEHVISTILLGNACVNSFIAILSAQVFGVYFGDVGAVYAGIAATAVIFVLGEVLPKTFAINNADRSALTIAPIIHVLVKVSYPVTHVTQIVCSGLLRLLGVKVTEEPGAEERIEELRGAIALHADADAETRDAGQMLHSILDLEDVPVADIMVHRRNMTMIDADQPIEEMVAEALQSPHTRIPLYRGQVDNIIGVLHAKALLRAIQANQWRLDGLDIESLAAKPWFIPDQTDLLTQLEAFRKRREHFAVVVDEYGALMGIVTLEDILEEIVGDIADEHDVNVEGVQVEPDGSFVMDGTVTLRDLNREFGWRLPDDEASTVAGLVLHEAQQIPSVGQIFAFFGFRFEILERQRNQLTRIKVTPPIDQVTKLAKMVIGKTQSRHLPDLHADRKP
ncbi:MAG: HlyC/CorC family transporter [Rhodospirillaceae bacterium]|nr:HlyC/CorC family transporter [Rhodospirillaceae bacterium]